ncbi:hypothetical protein GLAREA_06123 [Glarea lozoyensis ATCC 20868]|uniref:Uncharacterized protein n=1 Tax=Glarea lozoyensis (strain ATCC 20868 / MF5171) TaxID=1116229 RepID=S3DM14_GLAL2|nr:uncharacterized protein GLAREA_06123 [Glarea lozoyensis ATCC 20868]EPE33111.1 hypothetical protein GLAREA_06123 [Glarea lozoyensis ATCC 20868]
MSTTNEKVSSETKPTPISIPDQRRDSKGEHTTSPIETWRPSPNRTMSFKHEDLKRECNECYMRDVGGGGEGFTEVGEK